MSIRKRRAIKKPNIILILFFAVCLIGFISACLADEAEYAAPDAFINGSGHPYYGSLNPWNRRFFGDIDKNGNLLLRGGVGGSRGRRNTRLKVRIKIMPSSVGSS